MPSSCWAAPRSTYSCCNLSASSRASSIALAVCLFFGGVRNWLLLAVVSIGLPLALSQILWHAPVHHHAALPVFFLSE